MFEGCTPGASFSAEYFIQHAVLIKTAYFTEPAYTSHQQRPFERLPSPTGSQLMIALYSSDSLYRPHLCLHCWQSGKITNASHLMALAGGCARAAVPMRRARVA